MVQKHKLNGWVESELGNEGGDADRRRLKLQQSDYRKQKPLGIPVLVIFKSFPIIEEVGLLGRIDISVPKFHGMMPNKKLIKVNEKAAWTTMDSFLKAWYWL